MSKQRVKCGGLVNVGNINIQSQTIHPKVDIALSKHTVYAKLIGISIPK